ncbi:MULTISPECIES: hypothetical protein [Streptomyces]|uniref:Lantibiotic n=1 Tax=Streptomyces qinglanensis TaxID=943816 RepID=A0A1H9UUZ5_9ACTN|nr:MULTISPECIES: hypothetical protein [Streptomyces]MDF4253651.1 hypothetical protein [Streptomyces sp. WMMB303]SES13295.1 hypothetical protein SAMN05421870_109182 [Streptomyces qinglanensis]
MNEELLDDEFALDLRVGHTAVSTSSAAATNNGGCETSRTSLCTDTLSTCC